MRAYLAIKYHADHTNRSLIAALSAALAFYGFEAVCVVRDIEHWGAIHYSPKVLMRKAFDAIDTCAIVIVDVTEKGVGIGIEAGYAYAKGKPIITIARRGSDISTTLQGISTQTLTYTDMNELRALFAHI